MKRSKLLVISIMTAIITVITNGCSNDVPRPRGYFRIALQEKEYVKFDNDSFPYIFDYANVANIEMKPIKRSHTGSMSSIHVTTQESIAATSMWTAISER